MEQDPHQPPPPQPPPAPSVTSVATPTPWSCAGSAQSRTSARRAMRCITNTPRELAMLESHSP